MCLLTSATFTLRSPNVRRDASSPQPPGDRNDYKWVWQEIGDGMLLLNIGGTSGVFTGRCVCGGGGDWAMPLWLNLFSPYFSVAPLNGNMGDYACPLRHPLWPPLWPPPLATPFVRSQIRLWVGGGRLAEKNSLYRRLRRELPLRKDLLCK